MRRYAVCLVVLLTVALTPLVAGTDVDINFFLGAKSLDQDDWGNADRQGELGVHTSFGPRQWPVRIALDAMGSADSRDTVILNPFPTVVDLTQGTSEIDAGARRIWDDRRMRPFVGAGIAVVTVHRERNVGLAVLEREETAPGAWIDGGVFWRLGPKLNIGLEGRLTAARVDVDGRSIQAGGFHAGMVLGWGWQGAR